MQQRSVESKQEVQGNCQGYSLLCTVQNYEPTNHEESMNSSQATQSPDIYAARMCYILYGVQGWVLE